MSIQKKSLISALKTTKRANIASTPAAEGVKGEKAVSSKLVSSKAIHSKRVFSNKSVTSKAVR